MTIYHYGLITVVTLAPSGVPMQSSNMKTRFPVSPLENHLRYRLVELYSAQEKGAKLRIVKRNVFNLSRISISLFLCQYLTVQLEIRMNSSGSLINNNTINTKRVREDCVRRKGKGGNEL